MKFVRYLFTVHFVRRANMFKGLCLFIPVLLAFENHGYTIRIKTVEEEKNEGQNIQEQNLRHDDTSIQNWSTISVADTNSTEDIIATDNGMQTQNKPKIRSIATRIQTQDTIKTVNADFDLQSQNATEVGNIDTSIQTQDVYKGVDTETDPQSQNTSDVASIDCSILLQDKIKATDADSLSRNTSEVQRIKTQDAIRVVVTDIDPGSQNTTDVVSITCILPQDTTKAIYTGTDPQSQNTTEEGSIVIQTQNTNKAETDLQLQNTTEALDIDTEEPKLNTRCFRDPEKRSSRSRSRSRRQSKSRQRSWSPSQGRSPPPEKRRVSPVKYRSAPSDWLGKTHYVLPGTGYGK